MKRLIALVLLAALMLGLAACGNASAPKASGSGAGTEGGNAAAPEAPKEFRVGYGEANITPSWSVPMGGYGRSDARYSKGVINYLMATCVAISDAEDNTILIIGVDLLQSSYVTACIPDISRATGVPLPNICISASHSHSTPDLSMEAAGVEEATALAQTGLVEAATKAMADRKPAQMYGATVETQGLNFVRRYVMNDGSYAGDNYGVWSSGIKCHETDADQTMQLVKFTRTGGKDVVIANFQTHPHRTGGREKYDLSSDIVGVFREYLSQKQDCKVVYFTGGSGNINPTSQITSENVYGDFKAHGVAMAEFALKAEYTPLNTGKVQVDTGNYVATVNHADDAIADFCLDLRQRWDRGEIDNNQVKQLGKQYSINSPYHALAIYTRSTMGETDKIPLYTYSFGDVGFVGAPYEMFDSNGMQIKEGSPFEMTIIATCSNGSYGYIPSQLGWDHGGYSVDTTKYVAGTAEALVNNYVGMLRGLYAKR